ncbi:hypothetical protein L6164_002857 [Bauhinia variegata]|uniref:Uncharacterized protein n=1 Tax=Bauhinia variegata TaxID=167791 RepID=A0ACB9PZL1_BAUVA|nr:hypothetical protein L6164_002857 [Bauhinia variegata]
MRLMMLQLLAITITLISSGPTWGDELKGQCVEGERQALLKFKEAFGNTSNRLSSWTSRGDCCKWRQVRCNGTTGHVISLDLSRSYSNGTLRGEISSSLLGLPYLTYLDLSHNDFMKTQVPEFLGSLHHLEHLNLSSANFSGNIPYQLGNLSCLQSLVLSSNDFNLIVNNLDWLHGLSSLKVLDLSYVQIGSVENWHDALNMLPSLVELHLASCELSNHPLSLPYVNITSLEVLDLRRNYFNVTIPDWLFEAGHRLRHLYLSQNKFEGQIPDKFHNMKSLVSLDISKNNLIGPIPSTLRELANQRHSLLKELYLGNNLLNGTLENCLAQFSGLVALDLSQNNFEGVITEAHLDKFRNLKEMALSSNRLTINLKDDWVPSFELEVLRLAHCRLGPEFPRWIQPQKSLYIIDLSCADISDAVPDWFWSLSPTIRYLNLSYNHLTGFVPDLSSYISLIYLDLSKNNFSGPLPLFPQNINVLDLGENTIFGPISHVCAMLGVNNSLDVLDLSFNNLSGNIPNCWTYGQSLTTLNLANNHLSGPIPDSFGSLITLLTLSLDRNNISGKIPLSLKNCKSLVLLDLGYNQLSGTIPTWIGEELQPLKALILSSNAFEGYIPLQLCQLKELVILAISLNQLSGAIPQCVFPNMVVKQNTPYINGLYSRIDFEGEYISHPYLILHYHDLVPFALIWKRNYYVYSGHYAGDWALSSLKIIDLSSNSLSGDIPQEITRHVGLKSLNLSRNKLNGSIPLNIGEMKSLEALDLSMNQLSGSIPTSIATMDELQIWNVSNNNLSGEIPSGNHLDTFDSSSYMGNPNLCGHPLTSKCPPEESLQDSHHRQGQAQGWDWDKIHPFYLSMALGFITSFWAFWGSLLICSSWRHAYFHFLSHICDKVYIITPVVVAKLRRQFWSQQVPK